MKTTNRASPVFALRKLGQPPLSRIAPNLQAAAVHQKNAIEIGIKDPQPKPRVGEANAAVEFFSAGGAKSAPSNMPAGGAKPAPSNRPAGGAKPAPSNTHTGGPKATPSHTQHMRRKCRRTLTNGPSYG